MKHLVSWSGGKDSTATIILAHINNEPIDEIIFSEVMFDKNISGEIPEHIDFIKNKAIPIFKDWGYSVKILHSQKTYMDCFNHKPQKGKNVGLKQGFPMSGRCCINSRCKISPIDKYIKTLNDDLLQYIGIAADEPKRLEKLTKNKISLLEKYNYNEKMAYELCKEYELLSPIYEFTSRGGCWFCPNARKGELKHLRQRHNELWQKLLDLESEQQLIGNIWNILTKTSIHEIEEQFKFEEAQLNLFEEREKNG